MLDLAHRSNGFSNSEDPAHGWNWTALGRLARQEARRVLKDDSRAEDAAQEALTRAWRNAAACDDPQRPEPWVRVIARREALRMVARERPQAELSEETLGGAGGQPAVEGIDVRAAMRRSLRASDRELLMRRYWLDETDNEIARSVGMPTGTVKTRLHRARQALRVCLMPS